MRFNMLAGMALFGCASLAAGAQATTQTTTTQTETKVVTVDGEVVRYEPGKVIVIRGVDNNEVVYNLAPSVAVPPDIQVGRRVTLYTEPAAGGSAAREARHLDQRDARRPDQAHHRGDSNVAFRGDHEDHHDHHHLGTDRLL